MTMMLSVGKDTLGTDVLEVDFSGDRRTVTPPATMTFGRLADLILDENPFLHRVIGQFAWRDGAWWLQNLAVRAPMTLTTTIGSRLHIGPSGQVPLGSDPFTLAFAVGNRSYELECRPPQSTDVQRALPCDGDHTVPLPPVPITADQHLLLVALCAPRLTRTEDVAASKTTATLLGVPMTTYNRRLDRLCAKLAHAGVSGLAGDLGIRADDRRRVLVDHALSTGLVTEADLLLLPGR